MSPEPPYPLHGGGAFRIASLIHYFARFAAVDLVLFSDSGRAANLPPGLIRNQTVIPLPANSRSTPARYARNARRAIRGVPPLVDRMSGLDAEVAAALRGKSYDLGIVEHSWAAGYVDHLAAVCDQTILDLHNIESTLHERCAIGSTGLVAAGHRRFRDASRKFEADVLPRFSLVLTTSDEDRRLADQIAPGATTAVYPNAYPFTAQILPEPEPQTVILSGNFEYHPNIDAVRHLMTNIWPKITRELPATRLRLVGRGEKYVREHTDRVRGVELTGPVEDALSEIARGTVLIAPLRTGSGTRIKILEAWAAGRPVVATTVAAEGLGTRNQENIAIADDPAEFARTVCELLRRPEYRKTLADGGRATLLQKYTWEAVWRDFDSTLQVTRPAQLNRYTG